METCMFKQHLHFADDTDNCKACVPAVGFKFAVVGIFGLLIGFAGLYFLETPPSIHLIAAAKKQNEGLDHILEKLNNMEVNLTEIKNSLHFVKGRLETQPLNETK